MVSILLLPLLMAGPVRPHVGDPVPTYEARTLAGTNVRPDGLRGQVTVVEFFASWCEPCTEGLAEILAIRKSLGQRFALMVVAVEGDLPALRGFLANHPLPAETTVVLDEEGAVARAFGEDRLPTTFFLDEGAIIRHINRGHGSGFRARSTKWLTEMLTNRR
jgi:peroxiredoxin